MITRIRYGHKFPRKENLSFTCAYIWHALYDSSDNYLFMLQLKGAKIATIIDAD